MLKQWFRNIPIAVRVTAWYTILLCLLFLLLGGAMVKINDTLRISLMQDTVRHQLGKAVKAPDRFDPFDDGIYTILYDNEGNVIRGQLPQGMPDAGRLPFQGEGPREFTANGRTFHYEDRPVDPRYMFRRMGPGMMGGMGGMGRGMGPMGPGMTDGMHDVHHDTPATSGPASPSGTVGKTYWIRSVTAESDSAKQAALLVRSFLILMPFFILLAAVGGYRIIKRGFRPVEVISATARQIGEEQDLSRRIELAPGKDELHQMAGTFNNMLDRLEESMQREKQFSSDVSHELRTPVSAIMAESEYAGSYAESLDEAKESFRTIHAQSKKMSAMINELLELTRMEKPDAVRLEPLDLTQLLRDTLQDYRLLASQHGIRLTADLPDHTAPVRGQAVLLQRAVGNLLDNALKFTRTAIVLSLQEKGGYYLISVQDDGQGMSPDDVNKVWERFYQADASRNRKTNKGLGLGLSFTAQVLKIHHGRYHAASALGKGSTFSLELPKG
ncbi:MAG TPA: hypothetical protein DCY37_06765 [Acidaminococcaceae bacterium]|nr:hypothetical protein [Acidaminococcaceae bacterium]